MSIDSSVRLSAGYLLWTACGAGFTFPDPLQIPWLITSALSEKQLSGFYKAAATFRASRDKEHAKAREAYEVFKAEKKRKPHNLPAEFDDGESDEEQKLRDAAAVTCQPILGDMVPGYDRILQALQFSRYRSTGMIDHGPGRAAYLTSRKDVADRFFCNDPVLRVLRSSYCETQVRSAGGGAVSYKSLDGATFYSLTVIPDCGKARHNLEALTSITGGLAVTLPGKQTGVRYSTEDFLNVMNAVYARGCDPFNVTAPWSGEEGAPPNEFPESVIRHIGNLQDTCSWNALRHLVTGVMTAERMLKEPGNMEFDEAARTEFEALLLDAAVLAYGVKEILETEESKRNRAAVARDALGAARDFKRDSLLPEWASLLRKALKQGNTSVRKLTRGDERVLTYGQLREVLNGYPAEFHVTGTQVMLLRDAKPVNPDVIRAFDLLASTIRKQMDKGGYPWISRNELPPGVDTLWHELVDYAGGMVLCVRKPESVPVAVVLRDRHGWLAPWRHYPEVVRKAEESDVKYE